MEINSPAIILSYLKYGDTSAVVRFYTLEKGLQALMWKGAYSPKNKTKYLLSPLNQVQIQYRFKENGSMPLLRKIESSGDYKTENWNIEKSTLLLFLSEILNNCLQNEPENRSLFQFIVAKINNFKKSEKTQLWMQQFLLELSAYLGAKPYNNYEEGWLFDLESGRFATNVTLQSLSKEQSQLWFLFLTDPNATYNAQERLSLLEIIILYYQSQVQYFKSPKSLSVIRDIYGY